MSSPPRVPFGVVGFATVAGAAALLVVLGPPRDRSHPPVAPVAPSPSVAAAGFTLTAATVDLPADDVELPDRAGVDAVRANCTACHSAAMIVQQPALTAAQWQAEVDKMRLAYHAPVDPAAVPAIVAYLTGFSPAGATTTAPVPPPRSPPTHSRSSRPTS